MSTAPAGYLYTRDAFGDYVGFEVDWMTWLSQAVSEAAHPAPGAHGAGWRGSTASY